MIIKFMTIFHHSIQQAADRRHGECDRRVKFRLRKINFVRVLDTHKDGWDFTSLISILNLTDRGIGSVMWALFLAVICAAAALKWTHVVVVSTIQKCVSAARGSALRHSLDHRNVRHNIYMWGCCCLKIEINWKRQRKPNVSRRLLWSHLSC